MFVSIPFIGYSPFLLFDSTSFTEEEVCVNSLYRVLSISTVSFYKPLNSRLSGLIFAGNCLNILTAALFMVFFCLSKNCINFHTIPFPIQFYCNTQLYYTPRTLSLYFIKILLFFSLLSNQKKSNRITILYKSCHPARYQYLYA